MENIQAIQDFLIKFPIFPYLWVPHCIMSSLALRHVYGEKACDIAKTNPLSCFIRAILYTYPGGIISCLLLAEPPIAFILTNMPFFITMVISWYLVFFTPKDLFTQFLLKTRVTFIFSMGQDFQRLHLCLAGVNAVAKIHPQAFFYMILIGVCKSSGFMVLKYIEHVLESGWVKPFSIPNYPTKTCVLASTAFAIQACGFYDFGSNSGLLAGLTLLAVNFRLFCQTMDPYERFESLTCQVFFGRVNILDDKASKKNQ